jgi:branched-chain amino acid transport system substrate-binding protein
MTIHRRTALVAVLALALTVPLALVGWSFRSSASTSDTIKIGASIPLSGPLAGFGSFQKWGYQRAVKLVNANGGITVDGAKKKVELILLDDKTDPNQTAANTSTLITKNKVDALLGSCTPALVNAGGVIADRARVPLVTGCDPLEAFKSVKKWQYVWDIFFWEPDLAAAPFNTMKAWGVKTNKKVAIIADNGPDGIVVGGTLWPTFAKKFGYTVVSKASFPVLSVQFGSLIESAKSKGADILLVDAVTPPAVALTKQLQAANYHPKVIVIEKGAEPVQYAQAVGKLADGVLVGGYWDPSFPYPGAKQLKTQFEQQTHQTWSQHIADSTAAAQVLLDAFATAKSTDKQKVNAAIAKTNKTYVVGPVRFDANHTSKLPIVEDQWQGGKTAVVWPRKGATGKFLFPRP